MPDIYIWCLGYWVSRGMRIDVCSTHKWPPTAPGTCICHLERQGGARRGSTWRSGGGCINMKFISRIYLLTKNKTIFRFWFHATWYEPPHDKTNKMTCAPSEVSEQPEHPPSLIKFFAVRETFGLQLPTECTTKTLIRLPAEIVWPRYWKNRVFEVFVVSFSQILHWFKHQFLYKQRVSCMQYNVTRIKGEFDLI